jgi:NAD-dependent DNA ligase
MNPKAALLFRGSVFVLLRVAPPSGAVDFDSQQVEQSIRSHSGQILSLKLLEAIKVDRRAAAKEKNSNGNKRKCYVVCWGHTGHTASQLTIHPLLSQVRRHDLCDLVQVTPVWLQTCCSEEKVVGVDRCPILLGPQKWPIQSLVVHNGNNNEGGFPKEKKGTKGIGSSNTTGSKLRISVTGFSGSRRSAMIHLIRAMGATYDDSMRTSTSHLICRESSGQKYEKALEWKLHVVTIDWLYHIAEYSYNGKSGKKGFGCESRFSFDSTGEDTSK